MMTWSDWHSCAPPPLTARSQWLSDTAARFSDTNDRARVSPRVKRQREPSNGFTSETTVDSGVRSRTELLRGNAETRRWASAAIKSAGKTRLTQKCGALSMRFRWVCLCSAALCGSVQAGSVFSWWSWSRFLGLSLCS